MQSLVAIMSKIGRKPITIPEEVKVKIKDNEIQVEGPKGKLSFVFHSLIKVVIKDQTLEVKTLKQTKKTSALHGLSRTLISNMIKGVSEGFERVLELHGTGYRANLEGEDLILTVGFSHSVKLTPPPGMKFSLKGKKIFVSGINKQLVGQIAAQIRAIKKPEVYKGKGIRWQGEVVKLKPGKAAKLGEAGKE